MKSGKSFNMARQASHCTQSIAYVQAINLPILTLLRVIIIHAPSLLIPLTEK